MLFTKKIYAQNSREVHLHGKSIKINIENESESKKEDTHYKHGTIHKVNSNTTRFFFADDKN